MAKWIGVRTSAVLAMLGSLGLLAFAGLLVWIAFIGPPLPPREPNAPPLPLRPVLAGTAIFLTALAAWGLITGIGIFRRIAWARISILVFGGLTAVVCGCGLIMLAVIPFPEASTPAPQITAYVRASIMAVYAALTAIGVWWIALFSSSRTREYFAETPEASRSSRPLSISIIAWYLLIGAVGTALSAVLRVPAMLFGAVLTGWQSLLFYTVFTVAHIYLGSSLLNLQGRARVWGIAYFAVVAANGVVSLLLPGAWEEMWELQARAFPRFLQVPPNAEPIFTHFGVRAVIAAIMIAFAAAPIWFLARRRSAFDES